MRESWANAMPLYHKALRVPANTPKENPATLEVQINQRIVILVSVKFPAGCHDIVQVAGYYGIKQLFPYEAEDSITGDDETVTTLEWFTGPAVPFKLTFKGWSPGTSFVHYPVIRIVTLPDEIFGPVRLLTQILRKLDVWFWRIFRL